MELKLKQSVTFKEGKIADQGLLECIKDYVEQNICRECDVIKVEANCMKIPAGLQCSLSIEIEQ